VVRSACRIEGHSPPRSGALLYGTNFSIGVQKLFRLTAELAKLDGYRLPSAKRTTLLRSMPFRHAITLKEIIETVRPV